MLAVEKRGLHQRASTYSGGNDNKVCIWSLGNSAPSLELTAHQAAVKAMAWAPFQSNLLATGGGSADRTIKFHNTSTGALLNSVDAESQVWRWDCAPCVLIGCVQCTRGVMVH